MMPLTTFAGRPRDARSRLLAAWIISWGVGLCAPGCQSMPLGFARRAHDNKVTLRESESPAGIAGPVERQLNAARWEKEKRNNPALTAALAEYDAAQKLYDDGQYEQAEKAFKALSKNRRDTYESFGTRWQRWWGMKGSKETDPYAHYGDPVEEDAMFMLAESQFVQKKYSWAQDSYDGLLEKYPSTRHMEKSTQRMFRIGMYWLGFSSAPGADGDVKLAKNESIDPASPPKAPQVPPVPIIPNLRDRTKPVFDTNGRALQSLRSIWLHDAAGPLADDALMLSANHHLRTGDFVEATRLYKLMREQYPDSPHFQDAHLLGAYVTMASYEGAAYDGQPLQEATELKTAALQMFPNLSAEERQRLERDVARLKDAEIGRLWNQVEYYRVKRQPQSIEIYCNLIINKYPDSDYADRARDVLKRIKKPVSQPAPEPVESSGNEMPEQGEESLEEPGDFKPAELSGQIDLDENE